MKIYPAIDLIDGKCVRLEQGAFDRKKVYDLSPLEVARTYQSEGAQYLHVVDLQGSKGGALTQEELIRSLMKETQLKVQIGGGIRTLEQAGVLLDAGAQKVVIGSLAIKDPETTHRILQEFSGDRITLAFDFKWDEAKREERIATEGWQKTTDQSLWEVLEFYFSKGAREVLCTDIDRDGMLSGPNLKVYGKIKEKFPLIRLQASGGVQGLQDLNALRKVGADAAIIGKALYERRFTLGEALQC